MAYKIAKRSVRIVVLSERHFAERVIKHAEREDFFANQFGDLRFGNCRNVPKWLAMKGLDLAAFDHSAITDKGDVVGPKTLGQCRNLLANCLLILGIAREHLHAQRSPGTIAVRKLS